MRHLAEIQSDFQRYIVDQTEGSAFKQRIVDDETVGVSKRLGIYADAYRLRIIEALATGYPKLKALLGDDFFDQIARQYIDRYPSQYQNMRWVGDQMHQHIHNIAPQHPIAAELAQFEWALGLAFDAEDTPLLQIQDLAAIAPETWGDFRFAFNPSVQLLAIEWNVIQVWQALDREEAPPAVVQIKEPCLIWRQDLNSHYRSLQSLEYKALEQMRAGATFGALCEDLSLTLADAAMPEVDATQQAAQYLATWIEAGMISQLKP